MFTVHLHEAGGLKEVVSVYTLPEASATVTAWQSKRGLGASQLGISHGNVLGPGSERYKVSYNGRVWEGETLVHDPMAK